MRQCNAATKKQGTEEWFLFSMVCCFFTCLGGHFCGFSLSFLLGLEFPKLLRKADIQEPFPSPLEFCCHFSSPSCCSKQAPAGSVTPVLRLLSWLCSLSQGQEILFKAEEDCEPGSPIYWEQKPSFSSWKKAQGSCWCLKQLLWLTSCPVVSLIVLVLPPGVSLFWLNLFFVCLPQRRLVSIYLWEFSIMLMWIGIPVLQKDYVEKYGLIPWLLRKRSWHW